MLGYLVFGNLLVKKNFRVKLDCTIFKQITGTPAADALLGTTENDTISGLEGDDTIEGNLGSDLIDGNDTL